MSTFYLTLILPGLSAMYQTRGVDISLNANTQHKMPSSGEVVQPVGVEKTCGRQAGKWVELVSLSIFKQ
jgi:hypothetical protein